MTMKNSFVSGIAQGGRLDARTDNGMKAFKNTADPLTDMFFRSGAMRGQNVIPVFEAAFKEDAELALRTALWLRDVRGGAGERQLYRDILVNLCNNPHAVHNLDVLGALFALTVEVGRWDDLVYTALKVSNNKIKEGIFEICATGLREENGLCAKWMPRKGDFAIMFREYLGMSPKQYRKMLVELSNTVEQKMCAKEWDSINFEHVPSVAAGRYMKAFWKNAPEKYAAYKAALEKGTAKINASAVYPYDVIKSLRYGDSKIAVAQWDALPNYVGDANVLAMVDVSGSMECPAGGNKTITCLDVAVSLGLYTADKNKGAFKDVFLTFSATPQLLHLKGNLQQKMNQMSSSNWSMNTNLHAAFNCVLSHAMNNNVPQNDMPKYIIVLSDMQFDQCARFDDSAMQMIERKFKQSGYDVPKIIFWNLNDRGNAPVRFNKNGVALVSGFSPAIMKSILAGEDFTPRGIMLQTIMSERYNFMKLVG